jgi:long-chain acyl-CoA synthetase
VRRGFIADKYAMLIDALYSARASCHVETQVKFEDGRSGIVRADVQIREARTFSPAQLKEAG